MKKHRWLAPAVFALLAAVTIFIVSRQSRSFTAEGFNEYILSLSPMGIVGAVFCMFCFILSEGFCLLTVSSIMGYKRKWTHGIQYAAADIYFSAVTPSATGGQPAAALMMMNDGIPGAVTTVVLLISLGLYNAALFITFGTACIACPTAFHAFGTPGRIMIIVGAMLHALLIGSLAMLIFNDRLFLKLSDLFLHLGQRLHLLRNAEDRHNRLLKVEQDYRASAGVLRHHVPSLLRALAFCLLQRIALTLVPVVLYIASGSSYKHAFLLFSIQLLAVMGSNSLPIPGAVGVADYLFLDGYAAILPDPVNLEMLSRALSFYICILVCAMIVFYRFLRSRKTYQHKTGG